MLMSRSELLRLGGAALLALLLFAQARYDRHPPFLVTLVISQSPFFK